MSCSTSTTTHKNHKQAEAHGVPACFLYVYRT